MTNAKENINYILVAPENGPNWWNPDFSNTKSFEQHPSFLLEANSFSVFVHGQLDGLDTNEIGKKDIGLLLTDESTPRELPHFCALTSNNHKHLAQNCFKLLIEAKQPKQKENTIPQQGRDFFAFNLGQKTWHQSELSKESKQVVSEGDNVQFLFLTTKLPKTNHGRLKLCHRVLEDLKHVDTQAENITIMHSTMDVLPF